MIELRAIDGTNIDEVVALDVEDEQKKFILGTTNLRCFADAHMLNIDGIPASPFAIYADNTMIGFLMYIYDTTDHESFKNEVYYGEKAYFVWHFMIDKRYQNKGYGKIAFEKMLAHIEELPHGESQYIDLFYHKDNLVAKELYASLGFIETGIIQENSVHAIRHLNNN
ncbi:N-acetyltransferase [Lysinibacillus sp. 2017]|uniref:GNAT family N-acetyltransferase n=1 Tax=unclassified Lysinibacillus TaxID=2636778 RepID=UPI000D525E47|nr:MULTISPECIES: GNAT family N-acetyltransferase [unclassified Lysinibacillus]AWE07732.1 N-acetyltransferase [Lysinibacillus sp. 2017]TGN32302.1 GNAT family N-acetyltransferase [Lysinibacillus sp. S2017]